MAAVPRPQVGCGTGAFWPSGTVVTICTASGARQQSVKPSVHPEPGSCIVGPGPRARPSGSQGPTTPVRCPRVSAHRGALGVRRWDQARDALYAQVAGHLSPPGGAVVLDWTGFPGQRVRASGRPDETAACRAEGPTARWGSSRPTSVSGATCGGFGNSTGYGPGRARAR